MNISTTRGYDAAQASRENDDLDRWRFASDVVDVVIATPPDWSARIGIFGKWGEGKSTVLRFTEQMLREKGDIVFTFSPWAIQNWNDLWEDFGSRLLEALSAANIPFDGSWQKSIKDAGKWLESKGAGHVAEVAAALLGRDKLYNTAFGVLSRWLRYDGAQIQTIRKQLQNRRIVVLIDDLDRCAPALIPQLLLSLRELLDLPGFTFILAFDDEIVGRTLTENNPAWADGLSFLEKILDFRFHLPAITEPQKERLVSKAMARYCSFVPSESAKKIQDLLPSNPRKLKALIRSLAALQPQVNRHDPDELNWVDMWLAQMLRLESYPFFERLLVKDDTLEKEAGPLYQLLDTRSRNRLGNKAEQKNESLMRLIKESGVEAPATIHRLIQLIEAVRSRSSAHFRYVCELAMRPHAVTWKEFRSFQAMWTADSQASVVRKWITQHAVDRALRVGDVEDELFETLLTRRQQSLSSAAESASLEEHDANTEEAGALLKIIEQFLLNVSKLDAERFRKLYGPISYWIGFRKNPSDKRLRDQEETLLLKLLSSSARTLSAELWEVLLPDSYPDFGEGIADKQALRGKCLAIVAPKAAEEAITFVTREGGIQSLTEQGRFSAVKWCLFHPDSPVWTEDLRDTFLDSLRKGREDFVVYTNVRGYFDLLVHGLEHGLDSIGRQDIATVLSNEQLVRCLWETVTSRGIQYRMQITYIRARQSLIQNGVTEEAMPLTEDLRKRLEEEVRTGAANPRANA